MLTGHTPLRASTPSHRPSRSPRALFALSTELLPDAAGGEDPDTSTGSDACGGGSGGLGYTLQPTGRFAHSPSYVRSTAAAAGWRTAALESAVIRVNMGKPIHGSLCLLQRL
jgi:predicted TPR repeat methyltransferase